MVTIPPTKRAVSISELLKLCRHLTHQSSCNDCACSHALKSQFTMCYDAEYPELVSRKEKAGNLIQSYMVVSVLRVGETPKICL